MKITINDITLSSDFLSVPAQGSANIPVELENLSKKYLDYALVPCVGWLENGVIVSTTRSVTIVDEKKVFTLPAECFKNSGAIYISIGLIKDDVKIKTNEIVLFVGEAPDANVELPAKGTWETAVSSFVTSLFNERFEKEINKILEDVKTLNQETENLQEQINTAINYLGEYEWNGTKIKFKLGNGKWGPYKDIAGEFVSKEELTSATNTVKQLYLIMHPVGDIVFNVTGVNPGTIYGGTWTQWGKGKVPVGVDTDQTEFNTVEKTGGEKAHKLTISEMPSHNHVDAKPQTIQNKATGSASYGFLCNGAFNSTASTGGDEAHNNLQPYVTCYMWKRTA